MIIRPATLEDEASIRELYLAFLNEVEAFGYDIPATPESVEKAWKSRFRPTIESKGPIFVADHEGAIEGFVAMTGLIPIKAINHGVYVRPEWRRQGVGYALMWAAKKWCRQLGVEKIFDMVSLTNEAGLKLMAKLGEEPVAFAYNLTA